LAQKLTIKASGVIQANAYSSKGALVNDTSGNITTAAGSAGQFLMYDPSTVTGTVAGNLLAGSGIVIAHGTQYTTITAFGLPAPSISTRTSNYTLVSTDDIIIAKTASGGFTLTLPDCDALGAKKFQMKLIGWKPLTIATDSDDQIDELYQTVVLNQSGATMDVVCQGGYYYAFYY
jgi:hypothetical protein